MTRTALMLHDDPRVRRMAREELAECGIEVVEAETSFDAVRIGSRNPPELVLLGLSAVDERDLELIRVLREVAPRARILLIFPSGLRQRAAHALDHGAHGYLPEPFFAGELAALARQMLASGNGPTLEKVEPKDSGPVPDEAVSAAVAAAESPNVSAESPDVSALAAGIAHVVRNPLQILELVMSDADEGLRAEDLGTIREQVQRLTDVVDRVADYSGRREIEVRSVDLNALLEQVFPRRRRPGRAATELDLCAGSTAVEGSPELLRAAFEILRDRAERVTPSDGVVRVRSSHEGDHVEVVVTDGGDAPTPSAVERFFAPRSDPESLRTGTWLELASFAGIIRGHGGTAAAARGDGQPAGTSIRTRLPVRLGGVRAGGR